MRLLLLFATLALVPTPLVSARADPSVFEEHFSSDRLDPTKWFVMEKNWGGQLGSDDYNGGVVAENVRMEDGVLKLGAKGNTYDGPVRGIGRDGTRRSDGRRVGAAIVTRQYFGPGRFEARVRIIGRLGVCSAFWTFHYRESAEGQILNHEIDVELPGRSSEFGRPDFEHALFNSWVGEKTSERTALFVPLDKTLADGEFHIIRFDWHTGSPNSQPRIDFFLDGHLKATITTHVPFVSGRVHLGTWFPKGWAGTPDFDQDEMLVDWIRIEPFEGQKVVSVPETYPNAGLRLPTD
jgi:beta-glucanase (GH16 family)